MIIFGSDHGEALGDHGLIQKGCRSYDALIRVPLIVSCPRLIKPGIVSEALDLPISSYGTMYRNERYKIACYHGHEFGKLYNLLDDPGEFSNLWADPAHHTLKCDLLKCNFDASMLNIYWGPPRIGPM